MKVLVACEESQRVTIELRKLGNGVWSSYVEPAMGLHESRRYSRPTLTY